MNGCKICDRIRQQIREALPRANSKELTKLTKQYTDCLRRNAKKTKCITK